MKLRDGTSGRSAGGSGARSLSEFFAIVDSQLVRVVRIPSFQGLHAGTLQRPVDARQATLPTEDRQRLVGAEADVLARHGHAQRLAEGPGLEVPGRGEVLDATFQLGGVK